MFHPCQDFHYIFISILTLDHSTWLHCNILTSQICTRIAIFFTIWMKQVCIPCLYQSIFAPFHCHRNLSSHGQCQSYHYHRHIPNHTSVIKACILTTMDHLYHLCINNLMIHFWSLQFTNLIFHLPLYWIGLFLPEKSKENFFLTNPGAVWVC